MVWPQASLSRNFTTKNMNARWIHLNIWIIWYLNLKQHLTNRMKLFENTYKVEKHSTVCLSFAWLACEMIWWMILPFTSRFLTIKPQNLRDDTNKLTWYPKIEFGWETFFKNARAKTQPWKFNKYSQRSRHYCFRSVRELIHSILRSQFGNVLILETTTWNKYF